MTARSLDTLFIQFELSRDGGEEPPTARELCATEREDIRRCIAFRLDFDPAAYYAGRREPPRIFEVEFIYDGITPVDNEIRGYRFDGETGTMTGTPRPLLRFTLDR